jgi:hypothetical protein
MRHLKCLACKTCLRSTDSETDPIGDLCPVCGSLLEPVGDLGEIVGYRVIETRGSTSHRGASPAGELIADGVGEVIARTRAERRDRRTAPPEESSRFALVAKPRTDMSSF